MKVATLATRLLAPLRCSARALSSSSRSLSFRQSPPSFGVAFDIDGVLIRGGQALPQARDVLLSLREHGVPHIFLTNGGGCLEEDKAANLGRVLDLEIDPAHMVLSHTPMRELTATYADSRVLIMGSYDVYTVAKHYGFKKVVSIEDLAHQHPHAYPFRGYDNKVPPFHDDPIDAIIVMHDPIDWAPELQIAVDVLIGGNPPGKGREDGMQTPLYVSNDDFIFSGAYPYPRFAQGAFTRCLKMLYEQRTGRTLEVTRYGKPHNVTYDFAEKKLNTISGSNTPIRTIYGIGDNPHSDIHGANQAGAHWTSMLVRTGVYNDANGSPEHEPDVYADAVVDAVRHIYKVEGLDSLQL